MKKFYLFFLLLGAGCNLKAQTTDSILLIKLEQQNSMLQQELTKLEQRTLELGTQLKNTNSKVALLTETMGQQVGGLQGQMDSIDQRYGRRMKQTEASVVSTEGKRKQSVLWGIVIVAALAIGSCVAWLLLRKCINRKGDDIERLRAKADELNVQIVERMGGELAELQKIVTAAATPQEPTAAEPDHSLVKALADRITFMEMTLYRMDGSVKGHKQLTKSIKNMKDNLLANGYELVDMLGKNYVEGMKVTASFVSDDTLEEGKQIITSITKPQINYKGQMIQAAQITVSQNI